VFNKKVNIEYLQLSILDFIHFILMHSQTSQIYNHVKVNSQVCSNPILSDFEPLITHQSLILWIINKQSCIMFKSLKITMKQVLSLHTGSIRYLISVLGSKNIFQQLKNHKSCIYGQTKPSIKHGNQILTLKWKNICILTSQKYM